MQIQLKYLVIHLQYIFCKTIQDRQCLTDLSISFCLLSLTYHALSNFNYISRVKSEILRIMFQGV